MNIFEREIAASLKLEWMDTQQVAFHLNAKNSRALQFGTSFNGNILRIRFRPHRYVLDNTVFEIWLLKSLSNVVQNQYTRKQIIFYLNSEQGTVHGIDISYDPRTQLSTIIEHLSGYVIQQ